MRRLATALLVLLLAACTTTPAPDRAPARAPKGLASLPDPVPREEPRSRYGNHSPYVVFGKQYHVMPTAAGYGETGIASWYGAKFHGRPTSSGERYDMYKLTAAHKNLPIPTYVRVTNLDNGRSTVVRVNDRGPFHERRIIDLSYAAAVKLGFADRGTARVRVETITPSPPVEPQVVKPTTTPTASPDAPVEVVAGRDFELDPGMVAVMAPPTVNPAVQLFVQAGAFSQLASAERLQAALVDLIGDGVHIHRDGADELYRVRIGPVQHMREATRLQALIVTANFGMPLIVREP